MIDDSLYPQHPVPPIADNDDDDSSMTAAGHSIDENLLDNLLKEGDPGHTVLMMHQFIVLAVKCILQ